VGIRIALGGQPSRVWLGLVIASLRAVLSGAGVGAILSFALDTGIVRLLPELGAGDWTFRVAAALVLIGTGTAAAAIAARHAAAIEPVQALRGD
jgi:ABC-type antimicrobial peptide transport system permease subunit